MAIEISNRTELEAIASNRSGDYVLVADIDLSGSAWVSPCPDYDGRFRGTLDGQGHTISNMTGDPLFGVCRDGNGTIKNLILKDVAVTGNGALCGAHGNGQTGQIQDCSASGTVSGGEGVGGLVGDSYRPIIRSEFVGSVTSSGARRTGLFVGFGRAAITDCRAEGSLTYSTNTTNTTIGAFVGDAFSSDNVCTNCYCAATVTGAANASGFARNNGNTATSCYWDTTIGPASSGVGTGKTTTQMQTESTFVDWDFDTVWAILSGEYPQLQAFISGGSVLDIAHISQGQSAGSLTIDQIISLTVAAVNHGQTISALALEQLVSLTVASVSQGQAVSEVSLQQTTSLVVAAINQGQSVSSAALTQLIQLNIESVSQGQSVSDISFIQTFLLDINDIGQGQAVGSLSVDQIASLIVSSINQGQIIANINFSMIDGLMSVTITTKKPEVQFGARQPGMRFS